MRICSRSMQRSGSIIFRLLGKRHSASLVLIGTLALAGGATVYLPQLSSLAGTINGGGQGALHTNDRACEDQDYAWSAYTPTTAYAYHTQHPPPPYPKTNTS